MLTLHIMDEEMTLSSPSSHNLISSFSTALMKLTAMTNSWTWRSLWSVNGIERGNALCSMMQRTSGYHNRQGALVKIAFHECSKSRVFHTVGPLDVCGNRSTGTLRGIFPLPNSKELLEEIYKCACLHIDSSSTISDLYDRSGQRWDVGRSFGNDRLHRKTMQLRF